MLKKSLRNRAGASFKSEILSECYNALESEGFIRFHKRHVDLPLAEDFNCWVGLNSRLTTDFVEIAPFVGVHASKLEKLWCSLKRGPYSTKYNRTIASYARHMGDLAPEARSFIFTNSADIRTESKRLARLYATIGLEFSRLIGNYENLLPLLYSRVGMLGANPERYACCLFIMNKRFEAKSFVNTFLPDHREYFEDFAIPFLGMLESDDDLLT